MARIFSPRTRRYLVTGLGALLPTLLTLYLLYVIVVWIHLNIGQQFNVWLGIEERNWTVFLGDAIAVLALLVIVWFTGFMLATYVGRTVFRALDRSYRRVPLIRVIYPAVKQVTDFFLARRSVRFSRVVAVEYPRRGMYSMGFVTGEGLSKVVSPNGEKLMTVFIPSSPAPLTGYTIFVRRDETITLDLTVDEAIKLVISAGVVMPDRELPPGIAQQVALTESDEDEAKTGDKADDKTDEKQAAENQA
jgi:uncharacterized membrane protein